MEMLWRNKNPLLDDVPMTFLWRSYHICFFLHWQVRLPEVTVSTVDPQVPAAFAISDTQFGIGFLILRQMVLVKILKFIQLYKTILSASMLKRCILCRFHESQCSRISVRNDLPCLAKFLHAFIVFFLYCLMVGREGSIIVWLLILYWLVVQ